MSDIDMDRVWYSLVLDESSRYGWAIARHTFSGFSIVDSRRWQSAMEAAPALEEYRAKEAAA